MQAKSELPNMRAAMDRAKADQYESLQVGETHQHLRQIDEYRQKRREVSCSTPPTASCDISRRR